VIILTREVRMETNRTGKEYESSEWSLKTLDRKPKNSWEKNLKVLDGGWIVKKCQKSIEY